MGRVISYDGLVSDITARKEAEEQLKQAKDDAEAATKAKSEFLNNIAHDFRTPIHAILGFSAFLKAEHTNERQKRFAGFINESSKNLLRLVEDLLDVSRLTSGKLELRVIGFDLEKAVLSAVEVAKVELMGKEVRVTCAVGEKIPRVKGDEVRFNQILSNLVSNAVKYTDKGEIIVGISAEQKDRSRHQCRVRVSVKDTGLGISKEKQA
jgi:two-component system, sensor histidine kinase and response regulator